MQEPVYVLHLITCHGRIMPRLAELLLFQSDENSGCYGNLELLFTYNGKSGNCHLKSFLSSPLSYT